MNGISSNSRSGGVDFGDTIFTDKKEQGVTADDFLKLMVAQFQNQDFMNPVDDTQYLSQLAQFATMQQIQELASFSKQSYVMSLLGQTVTAAKFKVNGEIESVTGKIDKISLVDNEYLIYIGNKSFSLDQIMELGGSSGGGSIQQPDYGQSNFLLSLMGKQVTVKKQDGTEVTETVQRVSLGDGMKFMAGGTWYNLSDIVSVDSAEEKGEASGEGAAGPNE